MRSAQAKPMLAVWVGEDPAASEAFNAVGIPHYPTESDAVAGFMHLVRYRDALDALMETPPSLPAGRRAPTAHRRAISIDRAIADGRTWLDPIEVTRLLAAYAHSGDAGGAGARCRRGRDGRGAVPGRRHDRRGQDPVARYRAQVGCRRRPPQPDQRRGGARGRGRYPGARPRGDSPTPASPA